MHPNCITGLKVMEILLNGWILPIGGASSGLRLEPAQQACLPENLDFPVSAWSRIQEFVDIISEFAGHCLCLNYWRINCHVFFLRKIPRVFWPIATEIWYTISEKKYLKFSLSYLGQILYNSNVQFSWERYPGIFGLKTLKSGTLFQKNAK